MRPITKQEIETEYAVLVEIVRVIRAGQFVNADQLYASLRLHRERLTRDAFNRIIHVLELTNQVGLKDGILYWNRRVN